VKRYLEAEIEFVMEQVKHSDRVLELGCGYGRVLQKLLKKAPMVAGIDTSRENLLFAGNTARYFLLLSPGDERRPNGLPQAVI